MQTYLARDVRTLVNVGDVETFERFLMLMAGRVGQLLNYSSLANDCGVAVDTARRWTSVLATSFVIHLLRPYHRNYNTGVATDRGTLLYGGHERQRRDGIVVRPWFAI